MLTRLRAWMQRNADREVDESSNSFALMIVCLPVILAAFGIGVDLSRAVYVHSSLQNALDTSTVSGAAVVTESNGAFSIHEKSAAATTRQVYAVDRLNEPGTSCIGPGSIVPGTTARMCWKEPKGGPAITGGGKTLTYTVQERITNFFLVIINDRYQTLTLTSTATINQRNQ